MTLSEAMLRPIDYLEAHLFGYRLIMDALPEQRWKIVDPRNDSVLAEGDGPLVRAERRLCDAIAKGWVHDISGHEAMEVSDGEQ